MTPETDEDLDGLLSPTADVALGQSDAADPVENVRQRFPPDILQKYEIHSYRNAAVILSETRLAEFSEILLALRAFSITKDIIRRAGGNESEIPKLFSVMLRPLGWHETIVQGDLRVRMTWHERVSAKRTRRMQSETWRENFLDGHKVDYVKNRVALDVEWNSKDQTFDRDLYAFNAFSTCGLVDAAVLITRSAELNPIFRTLGPALTRGGEIEMKRNGTPRLTYEKYGASTTWMGKLLYRLNAGRNGGCPVLAIGIRPACISNLLTP